MVSFHVDPTITTAGTRSALIQSVIWIIAILGVFIPVSVFRYRHATSR